VHVRLGRVGDFRRGSLNEAWRRCGKGAVLGDVLAADCGHRGSRVPCGNGHGAAFSGYRGKSFDTVLGLVTVTRAWYHCAACGHGLVPRDAELGVAGTSLSPGLAAMNDLAAAAGPFAGAARLPGELAGVRLAVKRVERAAEASGGALAASGRLRASLVAARKLVPLPPSPPRDKLYAVIDGTGVPMTSRETAGRQGKGEDGRARTREVKLAVVFFTQDKLDEDGYPVRDRDSGSVIAAATLPGCAITGSAHEACSSAPASSKSAASPSSASDSSSPACTGPSTAPTPSSPCAPPRPAASAKPPAATGTTRHQPPDQTVNKGDLQPLQKCRAPPRPGVRQICR
jgi:hypothetical protein